MHAGASTPTVERVGLWASALCAVHCLATPLLVALAPSLGGLFAQTEWAEGVLLLSASALSLWLLYRGAWRRRHWQPMALFGAAVACLTGGVVAGTALLTATGSLLLGGAQLSNLRGRRVHAGRRAAHTATCDC